MKRCEQCKITTRSDRSCCPLCQSMLVTQNEENYETFPNIKTNTTQNALVFKILFFVSCVASIICVTINLMIPVKYFWSIYVLIGISSMWISLINAVQKRKNILKNIMFQVVILSILAVLWDYLTNWKNWSIDYVIPIISINAMVSITVVAKILKFPVKDYLIYLFINSIIGIIPIVFIMLDLLKVVYPSAICVICSVITFLMLLTFEGKNLKEELKRRFHM